MTQSLELENGQDNFAEFEREDTAKKLPWGWLLLFIGLIVWGIWYVVAYTPGISGWSQEKELQEKMETVRK